MVKKILTDKDCLKIGKVLNTKKTKCIKTKTLPQVVKKVKTKFSISNIMLKEKKCLKLGKVLNRVTKRCNKVKSNKFADQSMRSRSRTPMELAPTRRNLMELSSSRKSTSSSRSPMELSASMRQRSPMEEISHSRGRKIDEFVKKRAAKIIQKITMPFLNRVSANIDDRIKTYKMYYKYLSKYQTKQCLNVSKKNNLITYSLAGDNIKIVRRIGRESEYGAIYLSKGSNTGELFRFASKIMKITSPNLIEINILDKLTKLVISKKNPHFPIMYYNFYCDKREYNSDLPEVVNASMYYININELASGDLKKFIHENNTDYLKIKNALVQIYIAIYSFHCEGYFHLDAHWGNFLYHRIKPGGYIKYIINGKELYVENLGYLWVIWDFGLAQKIPKINTNMRENATDYARIIRAFMNKNIDGWLPNEYPLQWLSRSNRKLQQGQKLQPIHRRP
jgi:hypothetical protein